LDFANFGFLMLRCSLTQLERFSCFAAGLVVFLTACSSQTSQVPFDLSQATYVGEAKCVHCHTEQASLMQGSHHQLAMQVASEKTVLGDFNNATLVHHDIHSRMFRDGEKFMIHTEGPDGHMTDFQVKYVFGVTPLQQYMVEFPSTQEPAEAGELSRVQVLRISWDTEKRTWFYLAPPDVPEKINPTDDLHWTGIAQRWNNMCAECHSTDYQKRFSPPAPSSDPVPVHPHDIPGAYRSTFMEINVSCEACHGPGSVHLELAQQWFPGWNRQRGYGLANLKASAENQIQACAPCHSRRSVIASGFHAGENYYDYYSNQLLTESVYYPDGQVLDEDYVHGSFIQSKMYHKGIRCSDCHDPHTARLKRQGNEVCTSCHQHPVAKYDTVAHHRHKPDSEGAQCVNCHMPTTTYMAVDARRDHSLRIPRPDLSTQLETPNACTGCHLKLENVAEEKREPLKLYQDWMVAARAGDQQVQAELERANAWCDAACDEWYGENRRRDEHFGLALAAGQRGAPTARQQLEALISRRGPEAPYIARATALQILSQIDPQAAGAAAVRAIEDEHPLVRSTASAALLGHGSPTQSIAALEKALSDPIRSVRTEAARNLIEFPAHMWSQSVGSDLRQALTELTQGIEYNNDRAGAHMTLGILAALQGRRQQAITHYETAIAVEPQATGPRSNLAELLERNLTPQTAAPQSPGVTEDGNSPIRQEIRRLRQAELPLLARDAELLPNAAPLQYRYGLALYLDGQREQALKHLIQAAELEPAEAGFAEAVAMLLEAMQRWPEAIDWAKQAVERSGNSPSSQQILQRIQQAAPR
jgi:tetratricopeptide (TPR) repeat protein